MPTLKPFRDFNEEEIINISPRPDINTARRPIINSSGEKRNKEWGYEIWIHNSPHYCGKILHFNKYARFSMHFHIKKLETWYIQSGKFNLRYIQPDTAKTCDFRLSPGMVIDVPRGVPHQLHCLEEGDIFEVSTEHYDSDSYRVAPGDSQKLKRELHVNY